MNYFPHMNQDMNDSIARAKAHHQKAIAAEWSMAVEKNKRDRFIIEAAERGATAYRIAKELGLTTQGVDYILKRSRNDARG